MDLDVEGAVAVLERFIGLLRARSEMSAQFMSGDILDRSQLHRARSEIHQWEAVIIAIAVAVDFEQLDDLRAQLAGNDSGKAIAPCERLLGAITKQDRINALVGKTGPKLAASELHPWVWSAAAGLWDDGHHRAAVQQAAVALLDGHLPLAYIAVEVIETGRRSGFTISNLDSFLASPYVLSAVSLD